MRKLFVITIIIILAFIGGRLLFYYSANPFTPYTPPARPLPASEFEAAARSNRLEAVDNPTISKGVVVIDDAHNNAFFVEELNVLLSKIVARGFSYELLVKPEETSASSSRAVVVVVVVVVVVAATRASKPRTRDWPTDFAMPKH